MTDADPRAAIDAVWRIESARLIAGLARIVRDVGLAEELAQDALVAALEQWPESGVPDNPGAWLMATAKHRAIDQLRRRTVLERKHEELGREIRRRRPGRARGGVDGASTTTSGDDLLRLDLHRLPPGALDRGAGGADAAPARRPDHRRDRARVPRPGADDRAADRARQADAGRGARAVRGPARRRARGAPRRRCSRSIYLIFNEGYSATAGDDWMRPGALRGGAAPRPHPRRARARRSPRCTASSR